MFVFLRFLFVCMMKQANVSLAVSEGSEYRHKGMLRKDSKGRVMIIDDSMSSDDELPANHTAEFLSLNNSGPVFRRNNLSNDSHGLRRPTSEVQLVERFCCRRASIGKRCDCNRKSLRSSDTNVMVAKLVNQVEELEFREAALIGKVKLLKETTVAKEQLNVKLQGELEQLRKDKVAAELKATSFSENVNQLEAKLSEYKQANQKMDNIHMEKLGSTVKSLESLQQSFENEKKKWQSEIKSLSTELEEANSERKQLIAKLEETKNNYTNVCVERDNLMKDKTEGMASFTKDLASAREKMVKMETQISQFDNLKMENVELKKQNAGLRKQMDDMYGQLVEQQLRQWNNGSRKEQRPQSTISSNSTLSCGDLVPVANQQNTQQHQQLIQRIDSLLQEIKLSNGKYQMEHEKCLSLENEVAKMQKSRDEIKTQADQIRKQLAATKREHEETLSEFFEVRNKLSTSIEQLGKDTEEISKLEKEIKDKEKEIMKKTSDIEKLKHNLYVKGDLSSKLADSESKIHRLADECDQKQLKIDQMSLQLDSLFDSRHTQRVAYEEQIDALRQEISRLQMEVRSKQ